VETARQVIERNGERIPKAMESAGPNGSSGRYSGSHIFWSLTRECDQQTADCCSLYFRRLLPVEPSDAGLPALVQLRRGAPGRGPPPCSVRSQSDGRAMDSRRQISEPHMRAASHLLLSPTRLAASVILQDSGANLLLWADRRSRRFADLVAGRRAWRPPYRGCNAGISAADEKRCANGARGIIGRARRDQRRSNRRRSSWMD
jgi:hypothetical protein